MERQVFINVAGRCVVNSLCIFVFISNKKKQIRSWKRGRIFILDGFVWLENPEAVRFALYEMVKDGFVICLARGIYYYPEIGEERGMKMIIPSEERIAQCYALKERVRIIPYGD